MTLIKTKRAGRDWLKDNTAQVLPFTALSLLAIMVMVIFFFNVGFKLLARLRLQIMAETAAAGAGRFLAEAIATRASANVQIKKIFADPNFDESKHPAQFLTANDRQEFLNDPNFRNDILAAANYYVDKNNVAGWQDVAVKASYPAFVNNCNGNKQGAQGNQNTIEILVNLRHTEPMFLDKLAAALTGQGAGVLETESYYSVPWCQ